MANKIHIVLENNDGNYEPVLATFDGAKAKQKFYDIITNADQKLSSEIISLLEGVGPDIDGIMKGEYQDYNCVQIEGVWYDASDEYGEMLATMHPMDVV